MLGYYVRVPLFSETPVWVVVKKKVPLLGTLNNRCRIILRTPKGTIVLTTTHMMVYVIILHHN